MYYREVLGGCVARLAKRAMGGAWAAWKDAVSRLAHQRTVVAECLTRWVVRLSAFISV